MKKKKKKRKAKNINWDRIISLSAASQYIQNQLNEALKELKGRNR